MGAGASRGRRTAARRHQWKHAGQSGHQRPGRSGQPGGGRSEPVERRAELRRQGGAIVSQIGPVTQNLDPVLQNASLFLARTTSRSPISCRARPTALVDTRHLVNTFVQQGLLTRRLRTGGCERIVPERECAHRHAESIGGAGGADLPAAQLPARLRDGREQPIHSGGGEERHRLRAKRFDRSC